MTGDNDGAVFTDDLPLRTPLTLPETPALLLNRPSGLHRRVAAHPVHGHGHPLPRPRLG